MNFPASRPLQSSLPLAERRTLLLARIQFARGETAEAGRLVAADLQKAERSIHNGWRLLKATAFATGIVWSLNAASKVGRGRRFITLAISLLSTMRTARKIGAMLIPLTKLSGRQGTQP